MSLYGNTKVINRSVIALLIVLEILCHSLSNASAIHQQSDVFRRKRQVFSNFRNNQNSQFQLRPGQELIFSSFGNRAAEELTDGDQANIATPTTTVTTPVATNPVSSAVPTNTQTPVNPQAAIDNQNPVLDPNGGTPIFINNIPTVATMAPFIDATTASPQFLTCINSCPTTSEYNPICASNRELYLNEQKYNCALRCGANIQIVRRGSCEGLFQMVRG